MNMKCKIIACFIAVMLVCSFCLPSFAAAPEGFQEAYTTDFEVDGELPDDFYMYFNTYDFKPDNIKTEGDNTYYNGMFPSGSYVYSLYELTDYRIEFDIKTAIPGKVEENAYKSAIALHVPTESIGLVIEADNEDSDLTSFLGNAGIFVYFFDNILEVAVHTNKDGGTAGPINGAATTGVVEKAEDRMYGVYSVSYQFTMPEGTNFTNFTSVAIQEENAGISVYVEDALVCSIKMSEPDAVTTLCSDRHWDPALAGQEVFSGDSYRKVEILDAAGAVKATVEECVVPVEGVFSFANRANNYGLDNLNVYEKAAAATPEPEQPTGEPDGEDPTEAPSSGATGTPTAEKDTEGAGNWLIYVLVAAIAVTAVILVIIIVKHKKKS